MAYVNAPPRGEKANVTTKDLAMHQANAQEMNPAMTGAAVEAKASLAVLLHLTPTCRDSFLPLIHRPQAPFQYDLFEPQPLPQEGSQFTLEKLTALLGVTPTEEDISRSAHIVESIRSITINAETFTYEMFVYIPRLQRRTRTYRRRKHGTLLSSASHQGPTEVRQLLGCTQAQTRKQNTSDT
jgi:hypothetical protein